MGLLAETCPSSPFLKIDAQRRTPKRCPGQHLLHESLPPGFCVWRLGLFAMCLGSVGYPSCRCGRIASAYRGLLCVCARRAREHKASRLLHVVCRATSLPHGCLWCVCVYGRLPHRSQNGCRPRQRARRCFHRPELRYNRYGLAIPHVFGGHVEGFSMSSINPAQGREASH